jgi:putative redox protein
MAGTQSPSPIVVTHEGGLRFASQIRSHRIVTDQSERAGGTGSAPSPLELVSAALGSCVAVYVHQFLETRRLPHGGVRVEVTPRNAAGPNRIAELDVRVLLPGELPPRTMESLERVVRSCPVHNTLAHGAAVSVGIVTTATTVAVQGERDRVA